MNSDSQIATMVALQASGQTPLSADDLDDGDVLDLADDEGWEDLEPDVETVEACCLLCDLKLQDTKAVLLHCAEGHGLDIIEVQKDLGVYTYVPNPCHLSANVGVCAGLDFMGMVKLINYIRDEARAGNLAPDLSTKTAFQNDRYLKPVLEDDALLYSLHDIIGESLDQNGDSASGAKGDKSYGEAARGKDRIQELEEKLQRAHQEIEARKKELLAIKLQFGAPLHHESQEGNTYLEDGTWKTDTGAIKNAVMMGNTDSSYFASYSGHGEYLEVLSNV